MTENEMLSKARVDGIMGTARVGISPKELLELPDQDVKLIHLETLADTIDRLNGLMFSTMADASKQKEAAALRQQIVEQLKERGRAFIASEHASDEFFKVAVDDGARKQRLVNVFA